MLYTDKRTPSGMKELVNFCSVCNFSRVDVATAAWLQWVQCAVDSYTLENHFNAFAVDSNVITVASLNVPSAEEEKE